MDKSSTSVAFVVVTDRDGRIVAAAPEGNRAHGDVTLGITAIPGQALSRVQLPGELMHLKGDALWRVLSRARFEVADAKLDIGHFDVELKG